MNDKSKKKSKGKPKIKIVRKITVLFTEKGIETVARACGLAITCYGKDVILADTEAMVKILSALALGEERVII